MCEVKAHCPNCGQPDLDADETRCTAVDSVAFHATIFREYHCHQCRAVILVQVPAADRTTQGG